MVSLGDEMNIVPLPYLNFLAISIHDFQTLVLNSYDVQSVPTRLWLRIHSATHDFSQ